MRLTVALLTALSALAAAAPSVLKERQSTYTDYLFVYFTGEGTSNGEQIYMSVSNNNNPGSWTNVNSGQPVLTSNVGTRGVRDPSLIRSQDGSKYWIVATDLKVNGIGWAGNNFTENGSKGLVVWESTNLKTWTSSALRIVSPSNAGMTWAPDAIWDPATSRYLVFWTCNLKGDGWYIMGSYTTDFKTFTPAHKFLRGAGMDATIAMDKSTNTFYRVSKNGPGELIEQARATSLNGPWSVVAQRIGQGLPAGEGPLVFQDNQNPKKWHMFIDDYTRGAGYKPFETTNIAGGQWTPSTGINLGGRYRHGYVVPITAAERSCITGGACNRA
ncbi:hypothetical protein RB594_003810 [Gaeumannomyces avenae]